MGGIWRLDIPGTVRRYATDYFVETGTGNGSSLHFAGKDCSFKKLYSIDIDPKVLEGVERLVDGDDHYRIMLGSSVEMLPHVFDEIPITSPILFWLDAHFPGCYSGAGLASAADDRLRLPLEDELELIAHQRPLAQDVIIIDDLRIYIDGPFVNGPLPPRDLAACPTQRNIDFVHDIFGDTHHIEFSYDDDGYAVLTPKDVQARQTAMVF